MRLSGPLYVFNAGLAFALEIAALAALAWWGFTTGGGVAPHLVLGVGAPVAAAVLWGAFAAPKAHVRLPLPGVLLVKAVVFGAAALALWGVGHGLWGVCFAAVAAANTLLVTADRSARFHTARD